MTAVITGGAGALGAAIAARLAERGQGVALLDLDGEAAAAVADSIARRFGVPAIGLACDITRRTELERCWSHVTTSDSAIEIVVNNAGVFARRSLLDLTDADWARSIDVNLTAAFMLSQMAAREWIDADARGTIVNVASIAAFTAGLVGGAADYGASKAGLIGLTIHLAVDLGPHGIRVNAVAPGSFRSAINAARLALPGEEQRSAASVPLQRVGEPDEVADVVRFLALDATYVNGVVINVDGGTAVVM